MEESQGLEYEIRYTASLNKWAGYLMNIPRKGNAILVTDHYPTAQGARRSCKKFIKMVRGYILWPSKD